MTQYSNLARVFTQYIGEREAARQPWFISDTLNSDMLGPTRWNPGLGETNITYNGSAIGSGVGSMVSTLGRPGGGSINTQGAFKTATTGLQPSGNFANILGNVTGLLGVLATTYATVKAADRGNKSPEEAAQILRAQGISVPPGQENAVFAAGQADGLQINKQWLLLGALGLGALLILKRR